MPLFFQELAKKLAEKWLSLLVLPGLLLTGTAAAGLVLGQRRWSDFGHLTATADRLAADLAARPAAAAALVVLGVLLAATATGLIATALGRLVQQLWMGRWPWWACWLHRALTVLRRWRWRRVADQHDAELLRKYEEGAGDDDRLRRLARRRNRISLIEPRIPTWMGDRMAAAEARVSAEYGLDLASAWTRLWLLLAEDRRSEVRAAASAFDAAAVLAGWGVLYLMVGAVWWPAAAAGAASCLTAWSRGRRTIAVYADLAEAVVDLHLRELAEQLELPEKELPELGANITSRLRKGA